MKLLSSAAVRRCLVAYRGYSIVSSDYDQIELRVVAALAREQSMMEAARRSESLHILAATKLFGENYNPDEYKLAKNVNFTWVYGGSARTIEEKYGVPLSVGVPLFNNYALSFPALNSYKKRQTQHIYETALTPFEYKQYRSWRAEMYSLDPKTRVGAASRRLIEDRIKRLMRGKIGFAENPFGRRLPVDAIKAYAVVNYIVQSAAGDILKMGLLRVMDDPKLEPGILLPIHDEILAQYPTRYAEKAAKRLAEVMTTQFRGVPITASGKVYGPSWGHGYMKED